MTLKNITVNTPNNTDLYFLKADGSDFIQAPISETTHIGVLRYAPTEAGLYQGEVYVNASALKQYQKFPVALTVLNVLTVDVYVSITDPEDDPDYAGWFQVGKDLPVVGTEFGLLESDVPVGTDIWVMVRDSVNAGVYDIAQSGVMSLVLTSPSAGTSFILESVITVQWTASANIPLVNIVIESATGIKVIENINASLGMYEVEMIADSGSFDFGQELVLTVENSLQTIADSVTVEIYLPVIDSFLMPTCEDEYRVAAEISASGYGEHRLVPDMWSIYLQYSADGATYEDIGTMNIGLDGEYGVDGIVPAEASGTAYFRARIPKVLGGSVYSDPIEATVVTPEIVITPVAVTVDVPFTISGTCNLAKNLRISYAKDPYSSWTVVDNSVTVQPNGTWSVGGVVISETGNFRIKAEYIQDTVAMFDDTEDVVVASGQYKIDDFESYAIGSDPVGQGWGRVGSTPVSKVVDDAGDKVWYIKWDGTWNIMFKNFTGVNLVGKSLKYKIKASFANKVYVRVFLYGGGFERLNLTASYTATTSWVERVHAIGYDGNIDRIEFYLYCDGFVAYLNDIKAE